MELTFLEPRASWLLPGLLLLLAAWRRWRKRPYLATSSAAWLNLPAERPAPLRRLPSLLRGLALVLITLALMQPVVPFSEAQVESQGLDIVIALDLSSSMQEVMDRKRPSRDLAALTFTSGDQTLRMEPAGPTRLETTKRALRGFVSRRRDDRIGIVVFSDNAYVVSPLTHDYDALLHYVDMLDDRILRGEGMTAIGDGLAIANQLLHRQRGEQRRGQVVMVFTDGEHNFGRDPLEPLAESAVAEIRVHLIGVDLEEEIKEKESVGQLVAAVRGHGGRYFEADTQGALEAASAELDSLEKGLLTSKQHLRQEPAFQWFALASAALLLAATALGVVGYFADLT